MIASSAEEAAELEETKRQAAEYRDHLQRLQAEFDNYRKRMLREQTRSLELASEPILRRLLDVVDDFELALSAAQKTPDLDDFIRGVELVYDKLENGLTAEGIERIEADGAVFDPERMEALAWSGNGDVGDDGEQIVSEVLRPGYTRRGRVIRPAGVRVTHGQDPEATEPATSAS